ncbi:ubiquitin carboxyl-terminal hydrolase 9 [Nicotiana tomentosiformis]|uniref:ubiquitin carboxyl-terminal hydrolase 9 n=1 Tax=Nicotiana tomentosiformis TaxID=4098 RepID=UPI00051B1958|nr:ubiquitin carboxyl-terminal hydrolase 9 [Nicotiana tomentosiformis]XP_009622830.1 ubiquitin carboxyl-terminal hydrolase 9 [Nicotiana tomentosiformis]
MTIPDSGYMMENGSIELPCTPEEEARIIQELTRKAESNLREGNTYYVISNRWFMDWQRYVGQPLGAYPFNEDTTQSQPSLLPNTASRPGPIDNSDIIIREIDGESDDPQLIITLEEGRDYVLVAQEVWERLSEWYKGGPALPRKMISMGDAKQLSVEVFPLCLNLHDTRDRSHKVIRLSKKASLHELYSIVCRLKGIAPEKARIWDYFNKRKHTVLVASDQTLVDSNLQMDQDILLEVQAEGLLPSGFGFDSTGNDMALVPIEPLRSSVTIAGGPTLSNGFPAGYSSNAYQGSSLSSTYGDMEDGYDSMRPASRGERGGLAGLQNLGNTCFMNSAIQCLVHTPPLVEYFLQDYTDEINRQNPLGMHGELAFAFGELLRKLWSSGRAPVAPRAFKGKLGRFAPQFSGYNQHDSQELLAFLLDGLHEDLNRVKQKPYFETKDSDGHPDEEVADELWRYHRARNDSVIVDTCQGQYKSTLVCPVCNKISITFDPFMYLSLPLPSTVIRTMTVTVFYSDGSGLPMPYTVTVLKHGYIKDLIQALESACCLRTDEYLLLAEVYEHRIFRYFENPTDMLNSIKDDEHIVAYRLPKNVALLTRLEISHRYQDKCIIDSSKASERKLFLTPLVTFLEDPRNGIDIDFSVDKVLSPLRRKTFISPEPVFKDGAENGSPSEIIEEPMNSCTIQFGHEGRSMEYTEPVENSSRGMAFHLCLTDERGTCCRPVVKDTVIQPARMLKVILDWTEKEYELYDASYLKDLPEVHKSGLTVKKTKQEAISLFSCLEAFLKEEPLGPDDMWYCPGCKEHRQASKKLDLWRLPDILVFHLKRFSYSRWLKNKLDTFVNFPIHNLDLSKYVKCKDATESSHVYELYAISNHYGGLGGGHYTAYCKLIDDDRWYHFDDSHVSAAAESDIKTSAAYVLFYRRVKVQQNGVVGGPSQCNRSS